MSSLFQDKARPPDEAALAAALGPALPAWRALVAAVQARIPRAAETWKHYAGGLGWQCRVGGRSKATLWLVPHQGSFLAALALPEAALDALDAAGLPEALAAGIRAGRRLPEGRAARVELRGEAELPQVLALLALKAGGEGR